jgi:hypothetical protein
MTQPSKLMVFVNTITIFFSHHNPRIDIIDNPWGPILENISMPQKKSLFVKKVACHYFYFQE